MPVDLMRNDLREYYRRARDAHPALLVQRGLARYDEGDMTAKSEHIAHICKMPAGELYRRAYDRWRRATSDPRRFRALIMRLDTRLFAGLSGGAMLETGCALGHSHGAPYIPGSAVKGVVQSRVRRSPFGEAHPGSCKELFGADPDQAHPDGLAGIVAFHDAWWVPGSAPEPHANTPLVQEVVTTHHPEYYRDEGASPASDLESPVPNAQIAVQGSFLFVLEGPSVWTELAEDMLIATLGAGGIGAKTRSGYGYLRPAEAKQAERLSKERDRAQKESDQRKTAERERRSARLKRIEIDKLGPRRGKIALVEQALAAYRGLDADTKRRQREEMVRQVNDILRAAPDWPEPEDRAAAAQFLETAFDEIGWWAPGTKGEKKKKQEKRRREAIEAIRKGTTG